MKNTRVQCGVLLGLAFLIVLAGACVDGGALDPEAADSEAAGDPAGRAHHPFHVAVFDHAPTEAELQAELAEFLAAARGEAGSSSQLNPGGWQHPASGQKLVRIAAATSNISNAGTDSPGVQFRGWWNRAGGSTAYEFFVLDNPSIDDLNRNTVSVFYYLINVGNITDQFVKGEISNSGSDGWHCDTITLTESNNGGGARTQSLPFRQWVDYPSPMVSSQIFANNSAWLGY
jgi:hypothetical protein